MTGERQQIIGNERPPLIVMHHYNQMRGQIEFSRPSPKRNSGVGVITLMSSLSDLQSPLTAVFV